MRYKALRRLMHVMPLLNMVKLAEYLRIIVDAFKE